MNARINSTHIARLLRLLLLNALLIVWHFTLLRAQDLSSCQEGINQYEMANYNKAIELLDACLKQNKNNAYGYFNRGSAYLKTGNGRKGCKDLKKAIRIDPEVELPYYALSVYYFEEGNIKKALKWAEEAIAQFPKDALFYNHRGWIYFNTGQHQLAFKDFDRAINLDSTYASAYNNRGSARYKIQDIAKPHRKDIELARLDYLTALRLDSSFYIVYRNLGYMSLLLDQHREALSYLQQAEEHIPEDPVVYFYRAKVQVELKQWGQALAQLDQALQRNPQFAAAWFEKGKVYARLKQFKPAETAFLKAGQMSLAYAGSSHFQLARLSAAQAESDEMFEQLHLARKQGHFEEADNREAFLKDEMFSAFRADPAYQDFLNAIRK